MPEKFRTHAGLMMESSDLSVSPSEDVDASTNRHELAVLAHECREPLASILLAVNCSRECPDDKSTQREMRDIIGRQAKFLAEMVDGVLQLSQCQNGKLVLSKQQFDLAAAVSDAIDTARPLIEERKHLLTVSGPHEPVWINADPVRIRQVISNLLTNAAKYTPLGGRIHLLFALTTAGVEIEVSDDGAGIDREFLPRLFDLFQQGFAPAYGKWKGLGIGLALVKAIVELHGGEIIAHSDGPGLGSTFNVRIPDCRMPIRQPPIHPRVTHVHSSL